MNINSPVSLFGERIFPTRGAAKGHTAQSGLRHVVSCHCGAASRRSRAGSNRKPCIFWFDRGDVSAYGWLSSTRFSVGDVLDWPRRYFSAPLGLQDDTGPLGVLTGRGFYHQMVLFGMLKQGRKAMRSTINLDDKLMERARSLTGTKETAALVRQALETLVRVESGKRLIALGGTMPDAEAAPRRRSAAAK